MGKITLVDVLRAIMKPEFKFEPTVENTALLLVDMIELASAEYLIEEAVKAGLPKDEVQEAVADFDRRIKEATLNASRILEACRKKGIPPIHVKIEAKSKDARDTGRLYKTLGYIVPPGSKGARFLPEVAPLEGEIVLTKTHSSPFIGTNLDRILRDMNIENLILVGFYTDQCIEFTFIDALDYGYNCLLVIDACTTYLKEMHEAIIQRWMTMGGMGVPLLKTTEEVLKLIEEMK
jgi:nicotinamidase-related amidase